MSDGAILSGTLQDLDLSTVMDVTSLGRQTLRLEVISPSGAMIGFVVLKAGRMIAAEAGAHRGPAALALILNAEMHARFRVVRDTSNAKAAAPFGMVGQQLEVARSASGLFAEGTQPKIRVMEGTLGDFDVATLLQTIGMGRTYVEVDVLSEAGQTIGSVILKAGKIISAQAGSFEGLQAVRELLDCPKHFHFAVFRVDDAVRQALKDVPPVGGLSQVLMQSHARTSRPTRPLEMENAADRTSIMAGALSEFDVPTLLQTLGAGRQHIGLEVRRGESVVGTIMVKAAMVMSATAGELTGMAAFRVLMQSPPTCEFNVFRTSETPHGEPLGPMHKLLMAAMTREEVQGPRPGQRVAVMAGRLSDIGIVTLLETLSQNRQHTLVELTRNNRVLGTIHLKSGMVCTASAGGQSGLAAFHALLAAPADSEFCVYTTGAKEIPTPLGTIAGLLHYGTWVADTVVSPPPAGAQLHVVPEETDANPAKPRRRGAWIGIGMGMAAAAAAVLLLMSPQETPEATAVSMAAEPAPPAVGEPIAPAEPVPPPPVAQATPAEPAPPPVAQAAPAEPAPPPPVETRPPAPPPPVAQATPAEPAPPVVETRPPAPPPAPRMSTRAAQSALARLGYSVGPIDNIYGPKTKAAVTAFQTAEGLDATGVLDAPTMRALAGK